MGILGAAVTPVWAWVWGGSYGAGDLGACIWEVSGSSGLQEVGYNAQ